MQACNEIAEVPRAHLETLKQDRVTVIVGRRGAALKALVNALLGVGSEYWSAGVGLCARLEDADAMRAVMPAANVMNGEGDDPDARSLMEGLVEASRAWETSPSAERPHFFFVGHGVSMPGDRSMKDGLRRLVYNGRHNHTSVLYVVEDIENFRWDKGLRSMVDYVFVSRETSTNDRKGVLKNFACGFETVEALSATIDKFAPSEGGFLLIDRTYCPGGVSRLTVPPMEAPPSFRLGKTIWWNELDRFMPNRSASVGTTESPRPPGDGRAGPRSGAAGCGVLGSDSQRNVPTAPTAPTAPIASPPRPHSDEGGDWEEWVITWSRSVAGAVVEEGRSAVKRRAQTPSGPVPSASLVTASASSYFPSYVPGPAALASDGRTRRTRRSDPR